MKAGDFYKNNRNNFLVIGSRPRATPQAQDWERERLRGGGTTPCNAVISSAIEPCCLVPRISGTSASLEQGHGCLRRMLGQKCRTRSAGQGTSGDRDKNDIRPAVKRGRETRRTIRKGGCSDVMSRPNCHTSTPSSSAVLGLARSVQCRPRGEPKSFLGPRVHYISDASQAWTDFSSLDYHRHPPT